MRLPSFARREGEDTYPYVNRLVEFTTDSMEQWDA
jgi:hypothetical protein